MNIRKTKFNPQDQKIWDKLFSTVPSEWKTAKPTEDLRDCLKFFQKNNVKSVLDLGCGVGIWATFLSKASLTVKGVDFSSNAIQFASKWAAEEKLKIEYTCCPITVIPFTQEQFDGVVAVKILDNISREELEIVKGSIFKCLKEKGLLYCLFNPHMTTEELRMIHKSDNPTKEITLTIYTDAELKNLFPQFQLLDFRTYDYGFRGLFLRK